MKKLIVGLLIVLFGALEGIPLYAIESPTIPYNFRVIDENVCAGGHPLGPDNNFGNSDKKVLSILGSLKARGIDKVIDLENTGRIQDRYRRLLDTAKMKRLHVPMHSSRVPNSREWAMIKEAMKSPVYVHCKWGADRTGAVIGRYLVEEKGFAPEKAYREVITGGKFAGPRGGLKIAPAYDNLKEFILK
ncbi:MAG: hypothetical protein WC490_05670 [Candidatus Margulisiibacteriota bacterium]